MKRDTFIRYTPAGHKLRVFTVFHIAHLPGLGENRYDVRLSWGTSNPDTIERLVQQFGIREVSRIVPNNERFYHNFTGDEVKQRYTVWKSACTRDGLTGKDAFQEK